jgi:hypothetical protein
VFSGQANSQVDNTLTQTISRLTSDRDLQALLLVLGISPFVEALCGFGVGIIVIAPMLLELRLGAVRVALLSLLGQLTTAWGAMGVAIVLTASLSGLPVVQVGSLTALLSLPATLVLSLICLHVSGGKAAVRRWWMLALVAAAILTGGAWLLSYTVGVELVGSLASALTLAFLGGVGALVTRRGSPSQGVIHKGSRGATKRGPLWLAATSAGLKGQEGLLIRKFGPLVLWAIALHMLLLASILIPSPLVLCLFVLLVILPCLPTLRPLFLALPAAESGNVSSCL